MHGKLLVESNDFNIDTDGVPLKKKKYLMNFPRKSTEFDHLDNKIKANNFIYQFKTERRSPKDFIDDQNLIKLKPGWWCKLKRSIKKSNQL